MINLGLTNNLFSTYFKFEFVLFIISVVYSQPILNNIMKKIILSLAIFASTATLTLSAQGLCEAANTVANSASAGFETLKGKYTSTDYTGQWEATTKLPGAKSAIIDENSGMYIATMGSGLSQTEAQAMVNKINKGMGCLSSWTTWNYDNSGEMIFDTYYSASSTNIGADGGNYGGYAEGKPGYNNKSRDYANYDKVPAGMTVQVDLRRADGTGKWEVRILIYDAK